MTDHKYLQSYLFNLPSHYMYSVLKFKGANHRMPIVNGRYNCIPQINDHFNMIGNEKKMTQPFNYASKRKNLKLAKPTCTILNQSRNY